MPISKRNRAVTLSKTKKKGRSHKETIVRAIKQAVDDYASAYIFTFENMRNQRFKEFREQLKSSSRFFLGSNKVMQIMLGRSVADEVKPGSHKLSKFLCLDADLFCTNHEKEEVERIFKEHEEHDFARTGCIATEKRLLGIKMATFRLHLVCRWTPEDFEAYKEDLANSDVESS